MDEIIIHLQPTERFRRAQMMNHAMPGALLLFTGMEALLGGISEHTWSPWLNILAGGAVIATIVYEFRFAKPGEHKLVNWVDIFAGMVLGVEGINHLHPGRWFQPGTLYMILGIVVCLKGILHSRIPQTRKIIFSKAGFRARTSLWNNIQLRWDTISSGYIEGEKIQLATKEGKTHTVNLRRVENKKEVIAAFHKRISLKD